MASLNIEEKIQGLYSFKQRSNDAFLRWRVDIPLEQAMDAIKKIGRMYEPSFVIDDENRFVYENLVKWVNGDETMKAIDPITRKNIVQGNRKSGIYLAGSTGSGKTLCMEIIKAYASVVGARIQIYPDEPKTLTWIPIHANDIAQSYINTGEMKHASTDVLCIEDFGCEPETVTYMGNKVDIMSRIIEFRGDYGNKLTLITTNLPLMNDYTKTRYGNRVISRLAKLNYYELKGQDRRLAK